MHFLVKENMCLSTDICLPIKIRKDEKKTNCSIYIAVGHDNSSRVGCVPWQKKPKKLCYRRQISSFRRVYFIESNFCYQRVCYSKQSCNLKNSTADTATSRRYTTWQSVPDASCNRRVTQIPQYTNLIRHDALFCNRNLHMWTYLSNKVVHCRISVRCFVWFVRWVKTGIYQWPLLLIWFNFNPSMDK